MANYSDIAIVEGLRIADHKIMSYLWAEYAPRLQYFAENLIRNKEDAEEIVSTVFLKLPKASARFSSKDHITGWLYISTKNECLDYLRRRHVRQKQQQHYESHVAKTAESEEAAAERAYLQTELIHAIFRKMEKMPKIRKKIFEMTYQEGMNARQISDKLGITVSAVTTQRSRAIAFLKEVISYKELITLLILLNSIP